MKTVALVFVFFILGINSVLRAESDIHFKTDSAFSFSSEEELASAEMSVLTGCDIEEKLSLFQQSKLAANYQQAFKENKRLTAAMLTFALGMLGVHRLYLGTQPWIPALYLLTFGGGFLVLPLIDLGVILFCKDISKYEHNDKVLMWVK